MLYRNEVTLLKIGWEILSTENQRTNANRGTSGNCQRIRPTRAISFTNYLFDNFKMIGCGNDRCAVRIQDMQGHDVAMKIMR